VSAVGRSGLASQGVSGLSLCSQILSK